MTPDIREDSISPTSPITSISELTTEGKADYQYEWSAYTFKAKEYKDFQTNLKELTTWILTTISTTFRKTYYLENTTIDQWY